MNQSYFVNLLTGIENAARLHFQAHGAHQGDGVALGDDAGAQMVVEGHAALRHLVFEVDVLGAQGGVLGQNGEGAGRVSTPFCGGKR